MITHQARDSRKIDHVVLFCQRKIGDTEQDMGPAWTSDVSKTRKTWKIAVSSQALPQLLDKAHTIANIAVDHLDRRPQNLVTLYLTRHFPFDEGRLYSIKLKSARQAVGSQIRTWVDYHWEQDGEEALNTLVRASAEAR